MDLVLAHNMFVVVVHIMVGMFIMYIKMLKLNLDCIGVVVEVISTLVVPMLD